MNNKTIEQKIQRTEKEIARLEHQKKIKQHEAKQLERNRRNRRIFTRGGMLEHFMQCPLLLTDDQVNAQLARGIIMALPRELPAEQYESLVREYCMEQFVFRGMIADYAIHDKGDGNPHAHVMLTMCALDEHGQWLPKGKRVYMLDENGERIKLPSGDYKSYKVRTTDWDDPGNCERWRAAWADTTNRYLERAGADVRLDLRSYERQGVDLVPTVHMGPVVTYLEQQGIRTEIGQYNVEIKRFNRVLSVDFRTCTSGSHVGRRSSSYSCSSDTP